MPNISKIVFGNSTILDISNDSIEPNVVSKGSIFYANNGDKLIGNSESLGSKYFSVSLMHDTNISYTPSLSYIFANSNFNMPIRIGDNVQGIDWLFYNCQFFNSPVILGNNVSQASNAFSGCVNFNSKIIMYNCNLSYCANMFSSCRNFNQPIDFLEKCTKLGGCGNMFTGCYNLNQPIIIPKNARFLNGMFSYCYNLNQPINIQNMNIENCNGMFIGCNNLNCPINIETLYSNNYTSMFGQCSNFNQPIILPNKQYANFQSMFTGCSNFNQDLIIESEYANCSSMFFSCRNWGANLYFKQNVVSNVCRLMQLCNNTSILKSIYVKNATPFTYTDASRSITGERISALPYNSIGRYWHIASSNIRIYNYIPEGI